MDELISRRVSYGLELVDGLTDGSLLGTSRVSFQLTGPAVPGPDPVQYLVGRSRWVFEEIRTDVVFTVDADFYHSETIIVPAASLNGTIQKVTMQPRTGYPFPNALTRAVGLARLLSGIPVDGATVQVFPLHFDPISSTFVTGAMIPTQTTEDGQYVVWFTPESGLTPSTAQPTASRFNANASVTLIVGGVLKHFSGSIVNQELTRDALNSADIIEMIEVI